MSTTNNVELMILTIAITLFFLACLVLVVKLVQVINKIHRLANKADAVIDSVESAAESIRHLSSAADARFPLFNLISKFVDLQKKRSK